MRILFAIIGTIIGPALFILAAYSRTAQRIDVECLSHFLLFFLLGLFTGPIVKRSYTFFKYWIPISFSLLYASMFIIPNSDLWDLIRIIIVGLLIYAGYFLGIKSREKIGLLVSAPIIGVLIIFFILVPSLIKYSYNHSMIENEGTSKTNLDTKLNIEGIKLQNKNKEVVDIRSLLTKDEGRIIISFINCKPCRAKLKVLVENIEAISESKSIIVVYDGHKNTFAEFISAIGKYNNINILYDSAGIFSKNRLKYGGDGYPTELKVDRNLIVKDYIKGYTASFDDLYLKDLLK